MKIVDPETGASCRAAHPASCARAATASCSATGTTRPRRAEAIDAARWMHTGDLATMDDEGYVNIVGRIKDMIIRGGENIYPREIEEFLYTHPDVSDVQVIGVPSERYGEEVMAWVRAARRSDRAPRTSWPPSAGQDRHVQDPALLEVRRRVPDDGHRQGAEVQDARRGDRRVRSTRGGASADGVADRSFFVVGSSTNSSCRRRTTLRLIIGGVRNTRGDD